MFFHYWTLKESYVKASGVGLSVPLDECALRLDPSPEALLLYAVPNDRASDWKLLRLGAFANHLIAVCPERSLGRCQRLLVHCLEPAWASTAMGMDLMGESDNE
jgi:4'-phosphopantetheinyl transferase